MNDRQLSSKQVKEDVCAGEAFCRYRWCVCHSTVVFDSHRPCSDDGPGDCREPASGWADLFALPVGSVTRCSGYYNIGPFHPLNGRSGARDVAGLTHLSRVRCRWPMGVSYKRGSPPLFLCDRTGGRGRYIHIFVSIDMYIRYRLPAVSPIPPQVQYSRSLSWRRPNCNGVRTRGNRTTIYTYRCIPYIYTYGTQAGPGRGFELTHNIPKKQ
jgi:hypothetical protein